MQQWWDKSSTALMALKTSKHVLMQCSCSFGGELIVGRYGDHCISYNSMEGAPLCVQQGLFECYMQRSGCFMQDEAQKESERLSKLRDAERRAFEEQEAAAQAELAARTEAERKVIEERREQQRQILAEQRR